MQIERDITCCECGVTFHVVGEGDQVTCPNCRTDLQIEMKYSATCMYCHKEFIVTGYGDYVNCPYCGRLKRLTSYYHGSGGGYYSGGLETDYYDPDMEGAPGYYGGDD